MRKDSKPNVQLRNADASMPVPPVLQGARRAVDQSGRRDPAGHRDRWAVVCRDGHVQVSYVRREER